MQILQTANMIVGDNKTIWCGNLSEQVTEELLYELFLQAGPLQRVRLGKDKTGRPKNFAFITFTHEVSVPYAINLLRGTTLYNRTLTMQCRGRMALLPPPIRCFGPDPNIDFSNKPSVVKQFANMAENIQDMEKPNEMNVPKQIDSDDRLVMASLQGNWSHRHHPYRAKEQTHNRVHYRPRDHDNHRNREKSSGSWRDRRYNKKPYYRRD